MAIGSSTSNSSGTTPATNKGYVGRSSPSTTDPGQPNNPSFTGRNGNPTYGGAPTLGPASTSGGRGSGGGSGRTTTVTIEIPDTVEIPTTMTVDEVYGKTTASGFDTSKDLTSNETSSYLPSVEKQGDYAASSNEKSVVKTDTFGKQDEISVTPELVTENKGEVGNDTIQSVEGLDFQQKDKESQAVLDSKKSRDEVEAEEKADTMRDNLRNLNKGTDTKNETDFAIGESDAEKSYNEQITAYEQKLNEQNQNVKNYEESLEKSKAQLDYDANKLQGYKDRAEQAQKDKDFVTKAIDSIENGTDNGSPLTYDDDPTYNDILNRYNVEKGETTVETLEAINAEIDKETETVQLTIERRSKELAADQKEYESELKEYEILKSDYEESMSSYVKWKNDSVVKVKNGEMPDVWEPKDSSTELDKIRAEKEYEYTKDYNELAKESVSKDFSNIISGLESNDVNSKEYQDAKAELDNIVGDYNLARNNYALWSKYNNATEPDEVVEVAQEVNDYIINVYDEQTQKFKNTRDAIINSTAPEEVKIEVSETINKIEESQSKLIEITSEMNSDLSNVTPEQIETFVKANEEYLGYLKEANSKGLKTANTDLNTEYTRDVSLANDFDVTLSDGTTMSYSDFSAMMVTKSPQIAAAMYNAKAKKYEEEGKNLLANIERMKAKMAMDTVGSKFTFADDKVRNQFIQMAETNERATYAAYNNVINDESGKYSAEQKAEAEAQIKQAEMLSTMAATLKSSTGLFSGMGDSVSDGVYGTTNPNELETYQKVLNTAGNVVKIILGAGITPGAADAWKNLYYTAGDEVRESKLFNDIFGFDPDGDDYTLFQEYSNSATVGLVAGVIELGTGVVMLFNPATTGFGVNLISDSVNTFTNSLYGVQKGSRKSEKYTQAVLDYFKEARDIASKVGDEEVLDAIDTAVPKIENGDVTEQQPFEDSKDTVTVTENFELGQDEVNDFNNWVEGSGSNTADNDKFNQSLTYEEWLKLIEADPTMREYAKSFLKDKPAEEKAEEKTDAEKADAE